MRRFIPIKFFSWLLLVLMLNLAIDGMHANAHAGQLQVAVSGDHGQDGSDAQPHCPCAPQEPHQDGDGCDNCDNCTCHAPLTVQTFQLNYTPLIIALQWPDPLRHLPEVYLSKFIPPQIHA